MNDTTNPGAEHTSIDVVIAAWNRADTIERAIRSALQQPDTRSVIVVDDASSDDTAAIAEALAREDARVQLVRQSVNQGPAAARNAAFAVGRAAWITVLDGDDYLEPGRLARLLSAAPGWDLIADDLLQRDAGAPEAAPSRRLIGVTAEQGPIDLAEFVLGNVNRRGARRRELGFLKPLMRRSFLEQHGLRYDPALRLGEDYLLYAQAIIAGARFKLIPAAGYVSVMRADSLSGRHSRADLEALRAGDDRLLSLSGLSLPARRAIRAHAQQLDAKIQWLEAIEAFKARAPRRFLRVFTHSPAISAFVGARLAEQVLPRLRAALSGGRHR